MYLSHIVPISHEREERIDRFPYS